MLGPAYLQSQILGDLVMLRFIIAINVPLGWEMLIMGSREYVVTLYTLHPSLL